jgi:hypothetical protein
MWSYALQTPASFSPVSTDDLAAWLRLNSADAGMLGGLIAAATDQWYNDTQGNVLCSSTWQLNLDHWPNNSAHAPTPQAYIPESYAFPWVWQQLEGIAPTVFITLAPVTAITQVQYLDASSTFDNLVWNTLTGWTADTSNPDGPARIILPITLPNLHATIAPKIKVTFTAGYANANAVAALAAQAIKQLAAHYYNNASGDKGAYTTDDLKALPMGWESITSRFRVGCSGNWNR